MGTEIHIRRATPADADDIAQILHDAFGGIAARHNFPADFSSPEMIPRFISAFLYHPGIYGVVAESEGRVVGSNFLDCRDAIAGVGPISVDPAVQGRGAGRMLMRAVIDHGRSAPGTRGIRLVQDAFNTVSMSLYASLGFEAKEPLALMRGKPRARRRGTGPTCDRCGRRTSVSARHCAPRSTGSTGPTS